MRAVIQRVLQSKITINGTIERSISEGLLVLLGIEDADTLDDITWLCGKIARLRIFDDENGVMNKSVCEINGSIMLVSQFTLHASTKKGNRPSYIKASKPEIAIPLYNNFIIQLENEIQKKVVTGEFGADMKIELTNNGPVTIIIDTQNKE
jgi:D-tyrosyl-tRNA(Tyr) deacylase